MRVSFSPHPHQHYVHIYVNGKMRPVETTPGMRRGGIKENDGDGEYSTVINCKNFCKCQIVPPIQ
jgi:hypothetical protein